MQVPPPPPPPPPRVPSAGAGAAEAPGAPAKKRNTKAVNIDIQGTNRAIAPVHLPRIRDDWKNSYKSKVNGVPELENWKGGFLIARDRWRKKDVEITKQYNWAETWEDIYHDICEVLPETENYTERNLYELWTEHNHIKLFFDFELKEQGLGLGFEDLPTETGKSQADLWKDLIQLRLGEIIERSRSVLMMEYGIAVDRDDFAILRSNKFNSNGAVEKYSFHIVLTSGVYFRDGKHLKNFFDHVLFPKRLLEEDRKMQVHLRKYEGIDSGVYGISRMLRMPLCSKLGEVRPLVILLNHTFEQCLVTHCPPEGGQVVEYVPKRRTAAEGTKPTRKKTTVEQLIDGESNNLTVESQGELEKLFDYLPMSLAEDYDGWTRTGMFWKRAGGAFDKWDDWSRRYIEWKRERSGVESHRDPGGFRTKWDGFQADTNVNMFLDWVTKHGRKRVLQAVETVEHAPDDAPFEDGALTRITVEQREVEVVPQELLDQIREFRKISSVEYVGILHNEIAKSFFLRYSDQHKFSNGGWWYFNGVLWQRDDDAMEISKNILKWHKEIDDRLRINKDRLSRHGVFAEEEEEDAGEMNFAGRKRKAMSLVEATATDPKHKPPAMFMDLGYNWLTHDFSSYKYEHGSYWTPEFQRTITGQSERKLYSPKLWQVYVTPSMTRPREMYVTYVHDTVTMNLEDVPMQTVDISCVKNIAKWTVSNHRPARMLRRVLNTGDLNLEWPTDDRGNMMKPNEGEDSLIYLVGDMVRDNKCGFEETMLSWVRPVHTGTELDEEGHKCAGCSSAIEHGPLMGMDGALLHDEVNCVVVPGCHCEYHVGCFKKAMFNWIENGEDPNECICPKCTLKGIKEKVDRMNKKLRRIKQITQDGSIGNNNALKCEFHDALFTESLDMNTSLVGFKDGVFDLNARDAFGRRVGTFRKASQDDRLTKTVGYEFAQFDWTFYKKSFKPCPDSERLRFACGRSCSYIKSRTGKDGLSLDRCKNCYTSKRAHEAPAHVPSVEDFSMLEEPTNQVFVPAHGTFEVHMDFERLSDAVDGLSEADLAEDDDLQDALSETTFGDDDEDPFDPDDPKKCEHLKIYYSMELLEDLFEKIFPNPEVRHYARIFHSSLLCGECPDEKIHFYTGMNSGDQTGSNGKSTVDSLNMKLLGEYAVPGHPSLLTEQRESAGSANSAFMAMKTMRYVSFQEIQQTGSNQTVLNMQVVKTLTGNDVQTGRELYEKQSKPFLPTWKIVVSANKLPPVSADDGGTRRRLADIPFEAKFMRSREDMEEALAAGEKHVHLIDFTLKTRINNDISLRQAYFHMLARVFPLWRRSKLPKCAAVEAHTNDYLDNQDVIKLWLMDTFKFTGKQEDVVDATGLYEIFKLEKKLLPQPFSNSNKSSLASEVGRKARWGKADEHGRWYGYRPQNEMYARQLDVLARQSRTSPNRL
jgi:phage/plasmid-associated DNA primase